MESLHIDISKAKTELGWKPRVDVAAGVKHLVDWFNDQEADPKKAKS